MFLQITKSRFVAHKQKYYTTSLRIFLPLRLYSRLNDFLNTCRKRKTAIKQTAVLLRLVLNYEHTISFNTISSAQARMLFINPIHLIVSVAFSSSVTPCFFAISFIRYSAILQAEVSISARCSYNFPLVSRLKYSTRLCSLKYRCRNRPYFDSGGLSSTVRQG